MSTSTSEVCLVAGGAGYIGSNVCYQLLQAGHRVVMVDNFVNSHYETWEKLRDVFPSEPDMPPRIVLAEADLTDRAAVFEVFRRHQVDSVINLAGLKSVSDSIAEPISYYSTNIGITLNLLSAMEEVGCRRMIFSSSATIYGMNGQVPHEENQSIGKNLANPYGFTKYAIEQILDNLCQFDSRWQVTSLRYFNPVGTGGDHRISLPDCPKQAAKNIMPAIWAAIRNPHQSLTIFGTDYETRDGTAERDYIHISDLARAHVLALEKLRSGYVAYNVGLGYPVSVFEVLQAVEQSHGVKVPYVLAPRREGDVAVSYAKTDKIRAELNWEPEILNPWGHGGTFGGTFRRPP